MLELLDDSGVGLASPQLADGESVRGHWPETADKMVKNKAEPGFYGCAFGLTRRTLCRVGYFDQRFRWGSWEDADYGVRCVQNGLQLQITNQSVVYHYGGKTQTGVTEKVGSYYHDNMYRFGKKWGLNMNRPFVFNRGILEFLD